MCVNINQAISVIFKTRSSSVAKGPKTDMKSEHFLGKSKGPINLVNYASGSTFLHSSLWQLFLCPLSPGAREPGAKNKSS